jgi:CRISPR/Cas system-associated exonuclease Cas4 (RecB family)
MDNFEKHFSEAGLEQIIEYQKNYHLDVGKKRLQEYVANSINEEKSVKEVRQQWQQSTEYPVTKSFLIDGMTVGLMIVNRGLLVILKCLGCWCQYFQ